MNDKLIVNGIINSIIAAILKEVVTAAQKEFNPTLKSLDASIVSVQDRLDTHWKTILANKDATIPPFTVDSLDMDEFASSLMDHLDFSDIADKLTDYLPDQREYDFHEIVQDALERTIDITTTNESELDGFVEERVTKAIDDLREELQDATDEKISEAVTTPTENDTDEVANLKERVKELEEDVRVIASRLEDVSNAFRPFSD